MKRALFVCGQNALRSPTAERVFSGRSGLIVASAGLDRDARVKVNADHVAGSDLRACIKINYLIYKTM